MAKHPEGQIIGRRWKYAPPPWRMFDALTAAVDRWLPTLLSTETRPKATQATSHPSLVVYQPWLDPTIREVVVEITPDGRSDSSLRILATANAPLSDADRRRVRYRLGQVFGGALRKWVDEPHW